MKVKELIEKLEAFDGDDVVLGRTDDDFRVHWDVNLDCLRVFKPEQVETITKFGIPSTSPKKPEETKGRLVR
jgi:hypothetical protein